MDEDDAPTLVRWALPALAGIAAGLLLGKWWVKRAAQKTTLVGEKIASGFEILGEP